MSYRIVVDTNPGENALSEELVKLGECVERARLDVGDALVLGNGRPICVERKTWTDLASSIMDGRFQEQKSRMNDPDTMYCLLVEGSLNTWDGKEHGMSHSSMWPALMQTCLRDGIHVLHALNACCAARVVAYLLHNSFDATKRPNILPGVTKRMRDNLCNPRNVYVAMLSVIPGMSPVRAEAVATSFPRPCLLSSAAVSDISDVKCGSRRIGPRIAQMVHDVFTSDAKDATSSEH